jgi:hypothetical protein
VKLSSRLCHGVVAAAIIAMPSIQAAHAGPLQAEEKAGSLYVQCDGQPNNMTGGETAARLLGAVTLLALLAPPPESADTSKRKFGADGVTACSQLLDGEKKEGNASRRIDLILARAIHQLEQKSYDAAIADAGLARDEATAAGLMANPYYARSQGRASDLIESAALFRLGRMPEARDAALRSTASVKHSFLSLIAVPDYLESVKTGSEAEGRYFTWLTRAAAGTGSNEAERLEELGRFADAARIRDALVEYDRVSTPDSISSTWLAQAAVAHAIAGNKDLAAQRATEARANADKRRADGKPENNAAEFVELMDLYGIVQMANAGDMKGARRLFAARSQWVAVSFGDVLQVTRRLRAGAAPDELIGGLSRDVDQMWKERADAKIAERVAKDKDNKTLFALIPRLEPASSYEAVSKNVWRTDKSNILLKSKKPDTSTSKLETLFLYGTDPITALEAYTLHAALLARARGHQGFVIMPLFTRDLLAAFIMTGNRGAPGLPDVLFNDAEEVIADMSPIIPDPVALKARKAAAAAKR